MQHHLQTCDQWPLVDDLSKPPYNISKFDVVVICLLCSAVDHVLFRALGQCANVATTVRSVFLLSRSDLYHRETEEVKGIEETRKRARDRTGLLIRRSIGRCGKRLTPPLPPGGPDLDCSVGRPASDWFINQFPGWLSGAVPAQRRRAETLAQMVVFGRTFPCNGDWDGCLRSFWSFWYIIISLLGLSGGE